MFVCGSEFFGVSMALVSWFWICVSVVIPYVYSLSRYFWDFVFASV